MAMSETFSVRSPAQANGRDDISASLWQRYESLKTAEQQKDQLIEELLYRYEYLSEVHRKECEDHDREREYNRTAQRSKKDLEDRNRNMTAWMNRDPFILVLIDGDGMIFSDELLQQAELGGRKAASLLHGAIKEFVLQAVPDLPSDFKIIARIYANVKGLAHTCYTAGCVDKPSQIEDFFRGFTHGKPLFDFIDVGTGKDRADEKLTEMFKVHIHDCHCRQILFGCSHDNGYARLLEDVAMDITSSARVTLIEGVPFEKELAVMPFKTKKFPNLFRPTKLNIYNTNMGATYIPPFPAPLPIRPNFSIMAAATGNPVVAGNLTAFRSPSVSTTLSENTAPTSSTAPTPTSWASAAKAAALKASSPAFVTVKGKRDTSLAADVSRNRRGQRVDPLPAKYDKDEVNRVKKLKMCNVHFLRNECHYGDECTHIHEYNPSKSELETLKLVARMAPCQHGSSCEDVKCIYGHRCPAPDRKDGSKIGSLGKTCIFGEECRFPPEMHNMDTTVVKTTKV